MKDGYHDYKSGFSDNSALILNAKLMKNGSNGSKWGSNGDKFYSPIDFSPVSVFLLA